MPLLRSGVKRKIDKYSGMGDKSEMAKTLPTNADGYQAVLRCFYVDGRRHGAKQRLAEAIGASSRQVVDRWERYGIPFKKYRDRLPAVTGLTAEQIWPENFR